MEATVGEAWVLSSNWPVNGGCGPGSETVIGGSLLVASCMKLRHILHLHGAYSETTLLIGNKYV